MITRVSFLVVAVPMLDILQRGLGMMRQVQQRAMLFGGRETRREALR
jgi:hypothetical protein